MHDSVILKLYGVFSKIQKSQHYSILFRKNINTIHFYEKEKILRHVFKYSDIV